MGASGWHYVVPYNDDAEEALQKLRNEVFASGKYGFFSQFDGLWPMFWQMPASGRFVFLTFYVVAKTFHTLYSTAQWIARGGRGPRSIEEAVELAAESGTHSILDIETCGHTPDFGLAVPLSPARMRRLFGTDRPTADDLERVLAPAGEHLERWHCVYFPIYEDGEPVKLVFVGCSRGLARMIRLLKATDEHGSGRHKNSLSVFICVHPWPVSSFLAIGSAEFSHRQYCRPANWHRDYCSRGRRLPASRSTSQCNRPMLGATSCAGSGTENCGPNNT